MEKQIDLFKQFILKDCYFCESRKITVPIEVEYDDRDKEIEFVCIDCLRHAAKIISTEKEI